ncbi:MAG: hypothetical protein WCG77_04100 [Actinomycetes bacterium]|jgi:hypothetical protein
MSSESDATGAEGPTQDTGPSGEHPGEQAAVPPLVKILKNHTFVTPGQAERVPMTVRNVSGIVESFSLTPLGPAAPWVEVLPTEVSLFPGDEGTATITFRPPRVPGVVAGEYVVAIRALSQVMRDSASTDELLVTVAPYYQASSDIARSTFTVRTKAETQLEIVNRGNATVVYHVSAVDPEGYMKVELEEDKVSLAPGETAWVTLRLKLAPRLLGTANENRMVTAQIVPVRNADTDAPIVDVEPMVQRVTVLHKPFITLRMGWFGRIVFLITILALIMAVVFARVRANTPPENSGAPPVPVNFSATLNDSQQPVLTWDPSSGATTYSIYAIGTAGDPTTGSSPAATPITNPVPAVNPTSSTPSNSASPSAVDAPERPSPVCNNCSEVSTVPAGTTRFVVTDAPPGYDCYRIAAKVGTTQSLFSPRTCLVVPGANILADTNGSAILTPDRQLQTTSPSPTPTTPTVIAPCPPVEVKAQAIPGGGVALLWKKAEVPPKGMVAPSAVATSALATASAVPAKPPAPAKVCDPAKAITGWTAQQQLFSGWSDVTPSGQPNDTALQVADLRPGTEYCFRMRADAADGSSVYAKVVCAKTAGAANPPPLAPNAPAASPSTSAPVG